MVILNSKKIKIILVMLVIVIPFVNITKGIDVSDTGYILNSYKFVFSNPESINFSIIFTSIIGGILLRFIEFIGIPSYIGLKISTIIFSLVGIYISFKFLKKYLNENLLLCGFLIAQLLAKGHINTLMYTHLTSFFFILIGISLIKGILENKNIYLYVSGVLIAIAVFIRISNLAIIILICSIIYASIKQNNLRIIITQLMFFLGGFLSGMACSLVIITVLYGSERFAAMLSIYLNEALSSSDGHSISDSIRISLMQGINGLFWILFFLILLILGSLVGNKLFVKGTYRRISYIIAILLPMVFVGLKCTRIESIFLFKKFYEVFFTLYQPFSIVVAFLGIYIIYYCFFYHLSSKKGEVGREKSIIYFTVLLIMLVLPLGSNQGFAILYQSFYLQSAILVPILYDINSKVIEKSYSSKQFFNPILTNSLFYFLFTYFISMLLMRNIPYIYRDQLTENMSNLNHSSLEYTLTTPERASVINDIIHQMEKIYNPERKLITYGSIPLFSFLFNMAPFFDGFNGWIEMGQLTEKSMIDSLSQSEVDEEYPLILISHTGTNNNEWPSKETTIIMKELKEQDNKYKLINNYIEKNNYKVVYEGTWFSIYDK